MLGAGVWAASEPAMKPAQSMTAAVIVALGSLAWSGQEKPRTPTLGAEEILEKSVAAVGGREAYARLASTFARGAIEFIGQHLHGAIELYAKAPNKRLLITDLEHVGRMRQGFDGKVAWIEDPVEGLRRLEGRDLERVRLEAEFHRALKWRELYRAIEPAGEDQVDGRRAYVLRLTPKGGKPALHYYDAETFLLVRQDLVQDTTQGPLPVRAFFSDYREVGGIKTPFRIEQELPAGRIVIQFHEIRNNIALDDAIFRMPEERQTAPSVKP